MHAFPETRHDSAQSNDLALARALMDAKDYAQALNRLLPLVQSGAVDLDVLDCTSTCLFQTGDSQSAISLMRVATETWPRIPALWGKLAAMCQTTGDREGAIEGYTALLRLEPGSVNALCSLDMLKPFAKGSSKANKLRKLVMSGKLSRTEMRNAHFTLGRIDEAAGVYKSAFRHFTKGKQALDAQYDPSVLSRKVSDQVKKYSPVAAAATPRMGPRPIFITGLPRSGTTLVESILLRHSETFTVSESQALGETLSAVRQYMSKRGHSDGEWDWCGHLTAEEIAGFQAFYYQRALRNAPVQSAVMIDKMPMNCCNIGLAQTLFPDAGFVFMSRHPLDVGLSNFKTNYAEGNSYTTRLDWMGQTVSDVYRSVRDYKEKLAQILRIQSFEALVRAPDQQITSLLGHLDLDFQDACLAPQDGQGTIRTASVDQVREKINTKGLGKWTNYEEQLQPLLQAMGGQAWLDQWQSWDRNAAETGSFDG